MFPSGHRQIHRDNQGAVLRGSLLFSEKDNRAKRIIRAFREERPECHCPRFSGKDLDRFLASGVDSGHTGQSVGNMLEKLSKGMFIELRCKSLRKGVIEALGSVYDGRFAFVTDDVLVSEGHLARVLRKAIEPWMPPERVIYAATWPPADNPVRPLPLLGP